MSTGQKGKAHVQVAQCLGVCVCKMEYVLFKKALFNRQEHNRVHCVHVVRYAHKSPHVVIEKET